MNYGYDGKSGNAIIKNYSKVDNMIIITHLDGTLSSMDLTEENEEKIQNEMINQAVERSNSKRYDEASKKADYYLCVTIMNSLFMIDTLNDINKYKDNLRYACIGITAAFGLTAIYDFKKLKSKYDEKRDIQKYDIFLSLISDIEKNSSNQDLYDNVSRKEKEININTLDSFSLNDLKHMKKNLERIKDSKLNSNIEEKKLVKRR